MGSNPALGTLGKVSENLILGSTHAMWGKLGRWGAYHSSALYTNIWCNVKSRIKTVKAIKRKSRIKIAIVVLCLALASNKQCASSKTREWATCEPLNRWSPLSKWPKFSDPPFLHGVRFILYAIWPQFKTSIFVKRYDGMTMVTFILGEWGLYYLKNRKYLWNTHQVIWK